MYRAITIAIVIVVSGLFAWISEPYARNNTDLFMAIITMFSVFGGFLVAVMSIAGEPLVSKEGSWRRLELGRDSAIHRMDRARLLFYAYLVAAMLILVVLGLQKTQDPNLLCVLKYINMLCLWFSGMGVLFSFSLPSMLIGIQQSRIDGEIDRRKKAGPVAQESETVSSDQKRDTAT